MKNLPNTDQRARLIRRMVAILERERPWIELYHDEDYTLSHAWLVNAKPMGISYPAYKYKDVKPELRTEHARGLERAGALAAVSARCSLIVAATCAGRPDLLPGAICDGSPISFAASPTAPLTVLGVLFLLFVLFFAVTDPDDIARKAVGERARPEVYAQWKKNHGYDRPLFLNREHGASERRALHAIRCCSSTSAACSPSISAAAMPTTRRSPSGCGRGQARA